ncbi:hypothetical protein K5I29_05360 [Flavobacterium agricola]|uniref:AraC family transcriptional regulator n=1 Tax=Flavobacterium agricola TaxID=2870839 RepID=A0ABY6M254_9FLAO|nr:hypothetical protein [Flavobacterium agricola]UYW02327.1 hypothetical protein K5I29_05360 [Flavobacterium agricola]
MADKIIYDYDLFTASSQKDSTKRSLSVLQLNQQQFLSVLQQNINLKSTLFLLVLSGTAEVEINFRKHQVQTQDMLLLSFGHLFKIQQVSSDFVCLSLYIEKDYVAEMFSIDMLYKRVKYNVKMYKNPILHLNDSDFNLLTARSVY